GIVETVAVGTAVAQVDATKRQVDRAAGTIVDVVVAATEVRGAVPDQPGAAIAIGETVVGGKSDDGTVDVAGIVDLVGAAAADHGNGSEPRGVAFDGAAVVQRGDAVDRLHLHGDRHAVVVRGDDAGVVDQYVAIGPRIDADRGAV